FAWFAYAINTSAAPSVTDPMPAGNPTGTTTAPFDQYHYSITSTQDGTSTDAFSNQQSTWRVTSNTDSGAGTLRDAITSMNADAVSSRRYIVFALNDPTITNLSELPAITRTTTIDGLTQNNNISATVIIYGSTTALSPSDDGIILDSVSDCLIQGLLVQNHTKGITVNGGSSNKIINNYIGLSADGASAVPNRTGIQISGCNSCSIGGAGQFDRNIISGNTNEGIDVAAASSNTSILANYIGTSSTGTDALPNGTGLRVHDNATGTVVGAVSLPNVISGNSGNGAEDEGQIAYYNNLVGVAADGTTP